MSEHDTLHTSDFADQDPAAERRPEDEPVGREADTAERPDAAPESTPDSDEMVALLSPDETARFRERWQKIQTGFVDEPRHVVEQADALVAELMQQLAAGFAEAREGLEAQWSSGDEVSTEDLRVALTRYRSFFQRLLAA
jgi:hypothetical protein